MVKILSATVTDLIEENRVVSIDFMRDINAIHGGNGSGKTTLLKILHCCLTNSVAPMENLRFSTVEILVESSGHDAHVVKYTFNKADFEAATFYDDNDMPILVEYDEINWKVEGLKERYKWNSNFLDIYRNIPFQSIQLRSDFGHKLSEAIVNRAFAESLQATWLKYSNKTLSDIKKAHEQGLREIVRAVVIGSDKSAKKTSVSKAFKSFKTFLDLDENTPSAFNEDSFKDRIDKYDELLYVAKDLSVLDSQIARAVLPRKTIEKSISKLFRGKKIHFGDNDFEILDKMGNKVPIQYISSGEKQILRMMIDHINTDQGVTIIDEPELSLHIDWQIDLLHILNKINPDAQIIVATHSPDIMANIPDDSVIKI